MKVEKRKSYMDLTMMERVGSRWENGRIFFDRPKPTVGCIASGRRRRNAELNPICHLLALLGVHHILHVSGIRVKRQLLGIKCILVEV
jgi:hypothetical protein